MNEFFLLKGIFLKKKFDNNTQGSIAFCKKRKNLKEPNNEKSFLLLPSL
jgi:hypothetical protein